MIEAARRRRLIEIEESPAKQAAAAKERKLKREEAKGITDPFLRMLHELNCDVDFGSIKALPENIGEGRRSPYSTLSSLRVGKFNDLRVRNGRVYHLIIALPKEQRALLSVAGKRYTLAVDIRACWPTFYARCLWDYYRCFHPEAGSASPSDNLQAYLRNELDGEAMADELSDWESLFCAESDPRDIIMRETGLEGQGYDRSDIKNCLNRWVNGGKQFEDEEEGTVIRVPFGKLDEWFASRFPNLSRVRSLISADCISKFLGEFYEGPLMMDMALYEFGKSLGFILAYEYDGVGVFADPGQASQLEQGAKALCDKITELSMEKFGIPVKVVAKMV
jgi:hypothetical protein